MDSRELQVFLATELPLLQDEPAADASNTVLSSQETLDDVKKLLTVLIKLVHLFRFCQSEEESIPRSDKKLEF